MPLTPSSEKDTILFQVVSRHVNNTKEEKTICIRILLQDGTEAHVEATRGAIKQWGTLPKGEAHALVVPKRSVEKFSDFEGIGITHPFCLRLASANKHFSALVLLSLYTFAPTTTISNLGTSNSSHADVSSTWPAV